MKYMILIHSNPKEYLSGRPIPARAAPSRALSRHANADDVTRYEVIARTACWSTVERNAAVASDDPVTAGGQGQGGDGRLEACRPRPWSASPPGMRVVFPERG